MRACATAGGGVMFLPDEMERKSVKVSYADLVKQEESKQERPRPFGKKKSENAPVRKAA